MWWLPLATAAVIGIGLWILQLLQQKLRRRQTETYRAKYIQLISQLEGLTVSANRMESFAASCKDLKILDYFESCLRVLETLITAVARVPAFGGELSQLSSGSFLVKDCRQRFQRLSRSLTEESRGKAVDHDFLYGRGKDKGKSPSIGCYFCSRPPVSNQFSHVRVKIDDQVREVLSCNVCRDELQFTKKVKVLFFMRDGKPVHWSEVPGYQPSEDYWDINQQKPIRRETKFELIHGGSKDGVPPENLH